jgi:hypothetical protein
MSDEKEKLPKGFSRAAKDMTIICTVECAWRTDLWKPKDKTFVKAGELYPSKYFSPVGVVAPKAEEITEEVPGDPELDELLAVANKIGMAFRKSWGKDRLKNEIQTYQANPPK